MMNTETINYLKDCMREGYKYVVRNRNRTVMLFRLQPRKKIRINEWDKINKTDDNPGLHINNNFFKENNINIPLISWYDEKPMKIKDLLDMEEAEKEKEIIEEEKELKVEPKKEEKNPTEICGYTSTTVISGKKINFENLADTYNFMVSSDYKERFIAEYWQTKIRYEKLHHMVIRMMAGTLDFTPTCTLEDFETQLNYMGNYLKVLEIRAEKENIDLFYIVKKGA